MFTEKDLKQIKEHGLSFDTIKNQLHQFEEGIPYVKLVEAATVGNGIEPLPKEKIQEYIIRYENADKKVEKFVPASGAASRMFKLLFEFLKNFNPKKDSLNNFLEQSEYESLKIFFSEYDKFAFYPEALNHIRKTIPNYEAFSEDQKKYVFVKTLLDRKGMNFGNLPKGLIPFHIYNKKAVTAFEEHLKEAAQYAQKNGRAQLHFTITEEHQSDFKKTYQSIQPKIETNTQTQFDIKYSFQEKSTDTIAVDFENKPFRKNDGSLLFRPGGHGALIQNLNAIDADLIFIKNIDNVVIDKNLPQVVDYKKALAGILLSIQQEVFGILERLTNQGFSEELLSEANHLLNTRLSVKTQLTSEEDVIKFLHRPIRVCGMVKNEGAPGGGPFWVTDGQKNTSLQIVEGAQINQQNEQQHQIAQNATHFNPVDIVCGVKDYQGKKFDLIEYINPKKGFITTKFKDGKKLKALELPGLWNGGMAYWNTVFVEVPLLTFNPVKTVTDLLKPTHCP